MAGSRCCTVEQWQLIIEDAHQHANYYAIAKYAYIIIQVRMGSRCYHRDPDTQGTNKSTRGKGKGPLNKNTKRRPPKSVITIIQLLRMIVIIIEALVNASISYCACCKQNIALTYSWLTSLASIIPGPVQFNLF